MSVVIVANGKMAGGAWLRPHLAEASLVIAANGGVKHLRRLGWPPDVVIGDMDSMGAAERVWLDSAESSLFLTYPADKDQTDLELALAYALAQGADDILIAGAFGGRIDHGLANVFLLARAELVGRRVRLVDDGATVQLVGPGEHSFQGRPGDLLSLLPLAGDVWVARTEGLRWPLRDEALRFGEARGVSNVFSAENATLTLTVGRLVCVQTTG